MADLPAGVTEVARVQAKEGGYYILGSDGGVFTEGNAPFYGSYWSLPEGARNDPNRGWSNIYINPNGGYMLEATTGETYNFNPPPRTEPTIPVTTTPATSGGTEAPTGIPKSGERLLQNALAEYGLAELGTKLLDYYRGEGAGSIDATYIYMREQPEYQARFPGMKGREQAGLGALTEEQYIQWEGAAKSLFAKYEIPPEFYDTREELAEFIAGDVDPTELGRRVEDGYLAAMSAPPEYLAALQQQYGVTQGALAAFFLDPEKGEKIIEKQWVSAQIGGEARKTGFGALTAQEAERLQAGGLTGQEAQAQFGLTAERQQAGFFEGSGITREEQIAAIGGDVGQGLEIERQGKRRTAAFEGGGGAGGFGSKGGSGLGAA